MISTTPVEQPKEFADMSPATQSTRSHTHETTLPISPEEAFQLLIMPSAIRAWWGAARAVVVAEEGGYWAAAWGEDEDNPDYVTAARIPVFEPSKRIVFDDYRYVSKDGPLPFDSPFTTTFTVAAAGNGGSLLRVEQAGFPADPVADEFYAACEKGWADTFANIRRYVADRARSC